MLPIKTFKSGNSTIKLCVENISKIAYAILNSSNKIVNEFHKILSNAVQEEDGEVNFYVQSLGIATPCEGDVYDEAIGNEIAFRKVKLANNLKKINILDRAIKVLKNAIKSLEAQKSKLKNYVDKDIEALKQYNPSYEISRRIK